jgi:signal transduction histidine kinase/CheY-like chemotaxis protein
MSESTESKQRILVVDDEAIVLSLVKDALEDEDYSVETTSNAEQALEILAGQTFDLIITDIRMPRIDGIELVRRARDMQPDVGVIFMTGYANLASAKNAIKQGAFDYIMKPFELTEIRQAVRNAIKIRTDTAEKSSTQQLAHLSDLSQLLFTANDRASLMTSSLKFAMMHEHSADGSILFWDRTRNECLVINVSGQNTDQEKLSDGPLSAALAGLNSSCFREPFLIGGSDDHPFLKCRPTAELHKYFFPHWCGEGDHLIVVPVVRAESLHGWISLKTVEDTVRIKEADAKFLAVSASQLDITLENLSLLEQTQEAYAGLKGLQDETIELEKMATRGQMSAEIGHELNNFLGVVAGNLSLLDVQLKRGHYEDLGRYVSAMTETIEKIKTFTGSLMDLKQISSQKTILDFDQMLSEVVEYLKPQRRFQGVQLKINPFPKNLPFEGDATQIQQLLYNLFNNAADATLSRPRRSITVDLAAQADQDAFTLTIRDTGVGFPPELLKKAFQEKFTTKKSGHGFGLVVCKRIIETHGGKLKVDSVPDQGTSISITFPVAARPLVPA